MSDLKTRRGALLDGRRKTLENIVVLHLVQAMLGLVSPNMRAVAAEVKSTGVIVHFAFHDVRPVDREDVEDILADLDALLDNEELPDAWKIESELHAGAADTEWQGHRFRRVYEAKPR